MAVQLAPRLTVDPYRQHKIMLIARTQELLSQLALKQLNYNVRVNFSN